MAQERLSLATGGAATFVTDFDVNDRNQIDSAAGAIRSTVGAVDVLVSSPGIRPNHASEQATPKGRLRVMKMNLCAALSLCRAPVLPMRLG